jgi:shikimate dehydrogenase
VNYGCIGEHLTHSFSKEIHNLIESYDYILKEIEREDLDGFMKTKDFCAINVTIPYKEKVIPYLDIISDTAKKIGAVNTIVNKDGVLYGYNTDFLGMKEMLIKYGIDPKGKKALILGTGGTSKTAKAVLQSMGAAEIFLVSRNASCDAISYEDAKTRHNDAKIIINTTPCGMYPDTEKCPVDIDAFSSLEGVADAIYNPLRSNLILKAKEKGIKGTGGLYMLVAQAVFAAEKFSGKKYNESLIDDVFKKILSQKENVVLTGMPGSGKSTVGKLLEELTGFTFCDTDALIEEKTGMTIPEIFEKFGESYFRDIESDVIKEISDKTALIISTGGGAILRKENVHNLKKNGRLFFIDRPLKDLIPTSDRPLAKDADAIKKRYEERYDIYLTCADEVIKVTGDARGIADEIKRSIDK